MQIRLTQFNEQKRQQENNQDPATRMSRRTNSWIGNINIVPESAPDNGTNLKRHQGQLS
jgi:hypothetical protein